MTLSGETGEVMKVYNPIMYAMHEWQNQGLRAYFSMMSLALSYQSSLLQTASAYGLTPNPLTAEAHKLIAASREISARLSKDYSKPEFALNTTHIGDETVTVREESVVFRHTGGKTTVTADRTLGDDLSDW